MDDPWGSPWATADSEKDAKPPSPTKSTRSDLEPPPRAFFSGSGSPRIPAISGPSPWADDDDGFGDWAASETPAQTQSGWGGGWVAPSPKLTSPPRDDVFGGASPIAWPGNIALPKPTTAPGLRQPSPDPWSTDFSPSFDDSTPRFVIDAPPSVDPIQTYEESSQAAEPIWKEEEPSQEEEKEEDDTPTEAPAVVYGPSATIVSDRGPAAKLHEVRLSVESAAQSHESPFSSPSGDDTDPEDDRQDSPITSIDEDARTRQPVARKTSGKVQQLVSRFDGLARAASQEPLVTRRERSKSPVNDVDADEIVEFGDFEDADEEPLSSPERPATPRPAEHPLPESGPSTAVSSPLSAQKPASGIQQVIIAHGPVTFDVDLGIVDKLFKIPKSEPTGTENVYIPDHIIDDSFTEISERKTWYRISRMGSSRKYNAGDDENYRLVTWPTSTIREDTIKVVRRWMEEDSIAGRVTLGGGVSKTQKNMFGWDSSVEPVALDAVFRKKSHARGSSLQTSGVNPARKTSSSLRSPTERPSSVVIPPIATFGWSTNSPTTQTQSPGISLSRPAAAPTNDPALAKPEEQAPLPTFTSSTANKDEPFQDDEDDWGEMVSSPSTLKPGADGFGSLDAVFPTSPSFNTPSIATNPTPIAEEKASVAGPTAMPSADPWIAVDFSVFESPPKMPAGTIEPAAVPEPLPDVFPTTAVLIPPVTPFELPISGLQPVASTLSKQPSEHPFTPTTPLDIRSPIALQEPAGDYFKMDGQPANDAADRIIANLPDLSYMLR